MALNTAQLYNQPDFSDITITFSGREIKCHKLVLCTNSDYFRKLCGPGSQFVESKQNVIGLKDDDPDALEFVLKYLYTKNHVTNRDQDWKLQLEISKVAEKYLVPDLPSTAFEKFRVHVQKVSEPNAIFHAMMHIREASADTRAMHVADAMGKRHVLPLLKDPDFRNWLGQDNHAMWKHMDELTDFKSQLVKTKATWCRECRLPVQENFVSQQPPPLFTLGTFRIPRPAECLHIPETVTYWVPKDQSQKFSQVTILLPISSN